MRSGDVPPGIKQRVEIFSGAIGNQLFGAQTHAVVEAPLTANALTRSLVDADDCQDRSCFFERPPRLRQLDLFESVADQSSDALPFYSLHIGPVIRAGL